MTYLINCTSCELPNLIESKYATAKCDQFAIQITTAKLAALCLGEYQLVNASAHFRVGSLKLGNRIAEYSIRQL